jgi:hypothetical protein
MIDNLTICGRCGSNACYVQEITKEIHTHFCYGCGFQTNTALTRDSEFLAEQLAVLPDLYKDLMGEEETTGMVWMPSVVNIPNQGMVFAEGPSADNWKWAAVKAVPVKEEEKTKYPIPGKKDKYYEWRMDMNTIKHFEELDFMEALSYIEVLPE